MITVLGSINVDLTLQVPHLPATGETVLTEAFSEAVGGKGANQAIAAARDGARVAFAGATGDDGHGTAARAALGRDGIDIAGLARLSGPTGLATIWVDPAGRNMIAVASGANMRLAPAALDDLRYARGDTLVLQMEVPHRLVARAIERGRAAGMRVILNLAPAAPLPADTLAALDILVVNEIEAATLATALGTSGGGTEAQAAALAARLGITVVATLGAAGAVAFAGGEHHRVPALAVSAVDTTGAGDCFVGVLASGLDRGLTLGEAMRRAAVAGSLACTLVGAEPSFPRRATVDAALAGAARP